MTADKKIIIPGNLPVISIFNPFLNHYFEQPIKTVPLIDFFQPNIINGKQRFMKLFIGKMHVNYPPLKYSLEYGEIYLRAWQSLLSGKAGQPEFFIWLGEDNPHLNRWPQPVEKVIIY